MSKAVTKTVPKGPWYLTNYVVSNSTFLLGPKILTAFTIIRLKKILTVNKPITSRALARSTGTTSNQIQ